MSKVLTAHELCVQNGRAVDIAPEQRRLVTAGLASHQQGQAAMKDERYIEALELLQSAESAFDACELQLLQAVDNVGLMLLDLVWCAYKLQVRTMIACRPQLH